MTSRHHADMRSSVIGRVFVKCYRRAPLRDRVLALIVKSEGGQLYSETLRAVLRRWYSVDVGPYTYGSLLTPGNADRYTYIGAYVSVGPNVRRIGAAHPMSELSLHPFWYNSALGMVDSSSDVQRSEVIIGDDSWIGANVTILPGCRRIGIGAVVGAGAVVTKDVPDFAVVVGNPAKLITTRLDEVERQSLLEARPWECPPAEAALIFSSIRDRSERE